MIERLPAGSEKLVRKIRAVPRFPGLEDPIERAVSWNATVRDLTQPLDEGESASQSLLCAPRRVRREFVEQPLQRHRAAPARHAIVADVYDSARLEPPPDELDDGPAVLRADPGVDAMKRYIVEIRQLTCGSSVELD